MDYTQVNFPVIASALILAFLCKENLNQKTNEEENMMVHVITVHAMLLVNVIIAVLLFLSKTINV